MFKVCELDDTGTYSVEITEFVKNGEKDQTDCWLEVEGRKYIYCQIFSILSNIFKPFTSEIFSEYPHSFTSQLKGQSVVEHDRCEFEIDVEAEDAEISWYRDGKKINPEDGRVEIVVEGKKRKLIFKDTHLEDAGEITCKTNRDSSSCTLKVARKKFFLNSKLRTLSVRNI